MLLTFPMDEHSTGCIAWGKVTSTDYRPYVPAVHTTEFRTGTVRYSLTVTVIIHATGRGEKAQYTYETANVVAFAKPNDPAKQKLGEVLNGLKRGDPVIVFGRYREGKTRERNGVEVLTRTIDAFAVLPVNQVYDAFLAEENARIEMAKERAMPEIPNDIPSAVSQKRMAVPQISHPVVIENEGGWFE